MVKAETEVSGALRKYPNLTPEWTWKFRLLEAELLNLQGLSPSVLSKIGPDFPSSFEDGELGIRRHMLLGLAYARVGNFVESEQNIATAEKNCAALHCESDGEIARSRGAIEVRKANLPAADAAFRKSLQIARQKRDRLLEAKDLLNLGVAALRDSRYDEAIDWSNAAANAFHTLDAELDESKIAGNTGWIYFKLGDYNQALAMTTQAQSQAHKLHAVLDEIAWLANIGLIYFQTAKPTLAEDYYRRALDLAEKSDNADLRFQVLTSLASVSVQLGRLDAAEQYKDKAYELAAKENDRSAELFTLLIGGQLAARNKNYNQAEQLFTEVAGDKESIVSLRWQAQNELARLHEIQDQIPRADKEYREALSTVTCARAALAHEEFRLPFQANAAHIYDDYIHFLVKQGKSDEALQAADYSRAQTLAEGLGVLKSGSNCAARTGTSVTLQQAARAAGGPVLFYWLGPRQSYLWVVTAGQPVLITLPPEAQIETPVQNYRKALLEPPDVLQTRNADGIKLYDTLVAPAQKLIPPGSRVTIIADGVLNNLNFETLLVSGPKPHYWIEDVTIANASSLRMLAASHATARTGGNLLLIGDPVIPDPKFPPLPSAKIEMQDIERHFPAGQRQVFSGSTASPAAFLNSKPGTFSYLHFVAHGTASQLSPLDSAVILSKSTAEEDSYKLHARDIVAHPFRADLVVVSTCYGSGTTLYNGEGLVGLSWAFLRAGAHDVIGALWQVSDASTPQLMDHLYGELRKGRSPQDALRAAKLSLLHSDGPFRKPFYWAPFQLYTGS